MTEKGPEIDVDKINKPVARDGVERGSNEDGTFDAFYYDLSVRPESASGDALKAMTETQRQEYQNLLDQLKGAWDLNDEKLPSSVSGGQRAGAWMSVAVLTATGAGVAAAEAVSPSDSDTKAEMGTEIVSEFRGKIPSEAALENFGIIASAGATDVSVYSPEATPSIIDLVTPEYKQGTLKMIENYGLPLPLERIRNEIEAWRIKTFGSYEEELRGLGAKDEQWIKRGAQWLYAYDNSTPFIDGNGEDKFQTYVSREDIIKYVLAGKSKDVLCDPDGRPIFLMVNMTDKMKQGVKDGLELLVKDGLEGVYNYFCESGSCVLFAAELRPEKKPSVCLLNEYGVTNFNMTKDNTKKYKVKDMPYIFSPKILEESLGIDFYQLTVGALEIYSASFGRGTIGACEVFKKNCAGKILLGVENDDYMNKSGTGLINSANEEYFDSTEADLYTRQAEMMIEMFNLAGENFLVMTGK